MREKHRDGFLIIGDKTGSYFSGHSDSWKTKLKEFLSKGYIFESTAKEKK